MKAVEVRAATAKAARTVRAREMEKTVGARERGGGDSSIGGGRGASPSKVGASGDGAGQPTISLYHSAETDVYKPVRFDRMEVDSGEEKAVESITIFVNKDLFTCENANAAAATLFSLVKDSFCVVVKDLVVRSWKHLLWEDFLWPQSGVEDNSGRVVSVVKKIAYPPLGIWFSSGAIIPAREVYAHSDGFSRA